MPRLAWLGIVAASAACSTIACLGDDGRPGGPIIVVVMSEGGAASASDAAPEAAPQKALGEECATESECASRVCFKGTKSSYCTLTCTPSNAATVCAPPVFDGTCNNQGFCRRPG